ncbi:alpha/beta hydrolase [Jeotgalibacillus aurantiacus]|uniref:alpha/beta hydrolase n=1 Tax=Jeotgalibacillus aurantiacus TaxID=2763266 RepID=UPI001D0A835C|nr:alpha/beta hydrolase-fold protein [Jeotgalibacillus aurantiacus]
MIKSFTCEMTQLKRQRRISVYLPEDYQGGDRHYPVLYMHDAQNLFSDEESFFGTSWDVQGALKKTGLSLIVVGIDCNPEGHKRSDEYSPWEMKDDIKKGLDIELSLEVGGEGAAYADFIVHELKPLIDEKYRTIPDETAMAGSSAGGLISTYAMSRYPTVFRRVAALSNAYWFCQANIEALVRESDLSAVERFYFDTGTDEWTGQFGPDVYVKVNESMRKIIEEKGVPHQFQLVEGAIHNEGAWKKRLPGILGYLYT